MGELSSSFSRQDIETLIEAMGDWEVIGNQEFHVLQMVRNMPMPPQDHEAFEAMQQIKDHFKQREKDIKRSRAVRQETAIFLKAKLMLVRKDLGINKLFDMAATCSDANVEEGVSLAPKEEGEVKLAKCEPKKMGEASKVASLEKRLALAEFFIKDLGVQPHYEKFLAEKATPKPVEEKAEEAPPEEEASPEA